jgi:hypothetical protein
MLEIHIEEYVKKAGYYKRSTIRKERPNGILLVEELKKHLTIKNNIMDILKSLNRDFTSKR